MKKLIYVFLAIILIGLLHVTACQKSEQANRTYLPLTTLPAEEAQQAADDIVFTPGGDAYRANVHQQGVANPWPPVEMTTIHLGSASDSIQVLYRDHIVTGAGETRNNILYINRGKGFSDGGVSSIRLYSEGTPNGISLSQAGGGGLIGQLVTILVVEIQPDIEPGLYPLKIGLEIKGRDYGTIPCDIEVFGPTEGISANVSTYRSDNSFLTVDLPDGWAAAEGPEYLARPYSGEVAFNNWGGKGFWAHEVRSGNSAQYGPGTVMSQVPDGGAYVALVEIGGPPRISDEEAPPEYVRDSLGGLFQPHDWRQDSVIEAQFFQFYKWGRDFQLEVACRPDASDETVAELNFLLESWVFDSVPVGDIEWAGIQARKVIPEIVEPLKFSNRSGGRSEDDVERYTVAELSGDTVNFKFIYRWDVPPSSQMLSYPYYCPDGTCHWWEIEVLPNGIAVLMREGGAKLP